MNELIVTMECKSETTNDDGTQSATLQPVATPPATDTGTASGEIVVSAKETGLFVAASLYTVTFAPVAIAEASPSTEGAAQ